MWDYGSDALWEADTGYAVSADDLALTDPTRAALRDWIAQLDQANFEAMDPEDDEESFGSDAESSALDGLGRELWLDVRRELGDDYHVAYCVDLEEGPGVIWAPDGAPEPLPWKA